MNVLWQDSVPSFVNTSPPDCDGGFVFPAGDASQWQQFFSQWQPFLLGSSETWLTEVSDLLWTHGSGQPAITLSVDDNTSTLPVDDNTSLTNPTSLPNGVEPSGTTWQLADSTSDTGLGNAGVPLSFGTMPSDVGSLVWQEVLFTFEEISSIGNSSTLDATLNQILDFVWTGTGGSGSPPVTLPHAPPNPLPDGLTPLLPWQLVWTDPSLLIGSPNGSQSPLAPPVTGNSAQLTGVAAGSSFSALAPQQLIWTDPAQGVAATLSDLANTGLTLPNTLFGHS